mgnify:FL=1
MMIKNKEIKKLILVEMIFLIITIIFSIFIANIINNNYKQEIINNNSYIVGSLIEKHPELEDDIIASIILKENYELGNSILEKYQLNNVDYINYNNNYLILILAIAIYLGLLFINFIFIYNMYQKIKKIDQYMNNILNDDYSLNIKEYCEGDISNLKNDVYKMTVKLKEQSELLTKDKKYLEETLEDISHQIKTPLTSMYMINDILTNEKNERIRKEFLVKNKNQIERIEWLVISLLKLSKLDSGTVKLKKEKIKVKDLVNKAIEPIKVSLDLKSIDLDLNLSNDTVLVDINWTKEALLNIIKNACEHTKDKITITSKNNPLYLEIRITDNGKGIAKKDLKHIFERFYKGSDNKDSIGIGLNMSKKIINLQQGIIEVETKENIGSTFIIKLYKNNL